MICRGTKKEKPNFSYYEGYFSETMTAQKEEKHIEVLVFTHHQVIQAATNSLLHLVHVPESFINVFCYKKADVCVLEVWMI